MLPTRSRLLPTLLLSCLAGSLVSTTGCGYVASPPRVSSQETTAFQMVSGLYLRPWRSEGPTDRMSQGSIPEFDLNKDGRLSDLEKARAAAIIRENRKEFDRYGNLLSSLGAWFE